MLKRLVHTVTAMLYRRLVHTVTAMLHRVKYKLIICGVLTGTGRAWLRGGSFDLGGFVQVRDGTNTCVLWCGLNSRRQSVSGISSEHLYGLGYSVYVTNSFLNSVSTTTL